MTLTELIAAYPPGSEWEDTGDGERVRVVGYRASGWVEALILASSTGSASSIGGDVVGPIDRDLSLHGWRRAEPRPVVREHWGLVVHGDFFVACAEATARSAAELSAHSRSRPRSLARVAAITITADMVGQRLPVICDEHRVPFAVEATGG